MLQEVTHEDFNAPRRALHSAVSNAALTRRDLLAMAALGAARRPAAAAAAGPTGQLTWAIHVSLAPTWFDPAETQALITPYMVLYALHDAVVKPMPGALAGSVLAKSWSASEDALITNSCCAKGPGSTMARR